ncbi:hypothetical protein IU486_06645 [Streptomyces gardneri]|uniref:hypothetical protein n=1 Tax=Nocardia sputi TaxID=2943705 RepID=UPI001895A19E|nr:hypothetical protein [Nocardia sputi]MBF6164453.1 hypothetical protein [Streptomyces gardneri]MBF6204868.1 hypothetical protein [Streptomyces gardneri]
MTAAGAALPRPDRRDAGIRQYYSLGAFAMLAGHPYAQLVAWRHSTRVWVPSPDIEIGRWPGWSLACIRAWSPDGAPFGRPRTVAFTDTAETMRQWGTTRQMLWTCIDDGSIPAPVVWIDDRPGWGVSERF